MVSKAKESTFKSFDGTKISYRISGRGQTPMFCFNGIGVAKWAFEPLEEYFGEKFRIITWDYRGHGLSDNPKDVYKTSFIDLVEDGIKLAEKLNLKDAIFIGHSAGLQVALEVIRKQGLEPKAVISCLGTPGHVMENFLDPFVGQIVFDIGYILNAILPETSDILTKYFLKSPAAYHVGAMLKFVNPAINGVGRVEKYLEHISALDFSLFNQLVATSTEITSKDVIASLKNPFFVIASESDHFIPLHISREMQKKAKKSDIFVIRGGTHAALLEQPDIFNLAIDRFLTGLD